GCAHAASPAPQATSIETSSFMTQTPHRGGTGRRRVLRLRRGRGTQLLNGEHALPRPLNDRLGGPTFAAATGNERWRDPVGTIRRVRGGEEERRRARATPVAGQPPVDAGRSSPTAAARRAVWTPKSSRQWAYRAGRSSCASASTRLTSSTWPSNRTPLMKKVGVPFTALAARPLKSSPFRET